MTYHTPKRPTDRQFTVIKERYEVVGGAVVVKNKYPHSPAVGERVGVANGSGYVGVQVACRTMPLHHVSFYLHHGAWPTKQIDHINGSKTDNSPANLRLSSNGNNHRAFKAPYKNATSKYRGVCWHKFTSKWAAKINADEKRLHLGLFISEEEAAVTHDYAAAQLGFCVQALNLYHHQDALTLAVPQALRAAIQAAVTARIVA